MEYTRTNYKGDLIMAELEKKPVKIVETILRDAHQSQIATRMTTG